MSPPKATGKSSFIVSRQKSAFPFDRADLNSYWFCNWSIRMWPYRWMDSGKISPGDELFWYVSRQKPKVIRWRTVIKEAKSFSYDSKAEMRRILKAIFGHKPDARQEYLLRDKPPAGKCVAWSVVLRGKDKPRSVCLEAPKGFKMEQLGWMNAAKVNFADWQHGA